jgi:hypothetical protein
MFGLHDMRCAYGTRGLGLCPARADARPPRDILGQKILGAMRP